MIFKEKSGFTLLEIIIVIIIIRVLASLALPRYFKTVEYSRGAEGLQNLGVMRQSANRCYLRTNSYAPCALANLDVDDPSTFPQSHFNYGMSNAAVGYTITATRNTTDGGSTTSNITINQDGVRTSGGSFQGI